MSSKPEDKNFSTMNERLLSSLARELKTPLVLMARKAELAGKSSSDPAFLYIRETAENTLQLIDGYLLMARSEYGQQALPLEPIGIGAVIYDAIKDLRSYAAEKKISFVTDTKNAEVMANREGLVTVIRCLTEVALANNAEDDTSHIVKLNVKPDDRKVSIAVLSSGLEITESELQSAARLQGVSHLADAKLSDSGIRLAIADTLIRSFGGVLTARKIGGLRGLGFELNGSRQLQLML